MAFAVTPSLGSTISLNGGQIAVGLPYWDTNYSVASPAVGTMFKATDGHDYIFAVGGGTIASGVRADLNETGFITTTNATGAWVSPTVAGGTVSGQYGWYKRFVI